MWRRQKWYVKIVANGRKWSLPAPMGKRREYIYVCIFSKYAKKLWMDQIQHVPDHYFLLEQSLFEIKTLNFTINKLDC